MHSSYHHDFSVAADRSRVRVTNASPDQIGPTVHLIASLAILSRHNEPRQTTANHLSRMVGDNNKTRQDDEPSTGLSFCAECRAISNTQHSRTTTRSA